MRSKYSGLTQQMRILTTFLLEPRHLCGFYSRGFIQRHGQVRDLPPKSLMGLGRLSLCLLDLSLSPHEAALDAQLVFWDAGKNEKDKQVPG